MMALITALILWGTSFPVLKLALKTNPTSRVMVVRYGTSLAIVAAVFLWKHRSEFTSVQGKLGLCLIGVYNFAGSYLQFAGISRTSATKSAVLSNLIIAAVPFLAFWILGERMNRTKWITSTLSIVGALMLSTNLQFSGLMDRGTVLGDMLVTAAVIFWSLFIVSSRKFAMKGSGFWLLFFSQLTTFSLSLPLAPDAFTQIDATGFWCCFYLAVFCTVIPTALYNFSLKQLDATTSTILSPIETLVAALIGIFWFSERLRPAEIMGTGLILSSLLILGLPRKSPPPAAEALK